MKKLLIALSGVLAISLCAFVWYAGLGHGSGNARRLQIYCGAGLMRPMEELREAFERESGMAVDVAYGGSGALLGRMGADQSCDVFIPGASKHVADAVRRGWVVPDSVADVVLHVPVLAVSKSGAKRVAGLEDLANAGVRLGLGDPNACAIGGAADEILERSGLADAVKDNVCVRAPTVNQLMLYLSMNQVDAAIVWEDLMRLPESAGEVESIPIPAEKNAVRTIAAALGSRSKEPEQAAALIRFLVSPRAQAVWEKWGFRPCGG